MMSSRETSANSSLKSSNLLERYVSFPSMTFLFKLSPLNVVTDQTVSFRTKHIHVISYAVSIENK